MIEFKKELVHDLFPLDLPYSMETELAKVGIRIFQINEAQYDFQITRGPLKLLAYMESEIWYEISYLSYVEDDGNQAIFYTSLRQEPIISSSRIINSRFALFSASG